MKWRLAFFNFVFLGIIVLIDQVSKSFLFGYEQPLAEADFSWLSFQLLPSVNEYFAFSIPAPQPVIFTVIGIVFLGVLTLWLKEIFAEKQESIWLAIVLGGAIGNIIDRFIYGGVIDWIEVTLFSFSWSSFNIADIAIILGILGWVITALVQKKSHSS